MEVAHGNGRHGAQFSPDAVAESMSRGDGGFGRNQATYFDHPILQKAHWRWEIITYFFVGGIMGGSSLLASLADTFRKEEDAQLVRSGRYTALAGAVISTGLLIADLGVPSRFLNMLRVLKLKSPMSVGAWSLVVFANSAAIAASDQLHRDGVLPFNLSGLVPRPLRNLALAGSAAMMESYTGVLVSATAIPVWYTGRRHIPAIFAASAFNTACAWNMLVLALYGGRASTIRRLKRIETIAALCEAVMLLDYERRSGEAGNPLFTGEVGKKLKTYTLGLGIALPVIANVPAFFGKRKTRDRTPVIETVVVAALTLFGGFVLREAVILAGRASAEDPRAYLRHPE